MSGAANAPMSRLPNMSVLGRTLHGFQSKSLLAVEQLDAVERRRYDALQCEHRRNEWLIGRAAVRAASAAAGITIDRSLLSPPHARLSLSHAPGMSMAVAVEASRAGGDHGLGIDFERSRPMPRELTRLFATGREMTISRHASDDDLIRLWTIKEAVFKACPLNDDLWLTDLEVQNLSSDGFGQAVKLSGGARFATFSHRYELGWVSVALCEESCQ